MSAAAKPIKLTPEQATALFQELKQHLPNAPTTQQAVMASLRRFVVPELAQGQLYETAAKTRIVLASDGLGDYVPVCFGQTSCAIAHNYHIGRKFTREQLVEWLDEEGYKYIGTAEISVKPL